MTLLFGICFVLYMYFVKLSESRDVGSSWKCLHLANLTSNFENLDCSSVARVDFFFFSFFFFGGGSKIVVYPEIL